MSYVNPAVLRSWAILFYGRVLTLCLAFALMLTACGADGAAGSGSTLTVRATGDLKLDDPRLVEAVRRWNEAVGVEFLVLTHDRMADIWVGVGLSCDTGSDVGLTHDLGTFQSVCIRANVPESVVTHELGHALGLGHDPTPGSVMFPYASSERGTITMEAVGLVRRFLGLD